MRLEIIIATTGRADILVEMLAWLERQHRLPDAVTVVGAEATDLPEACPSAFPVECIIAKKGSCSQRNAALDLVAGRADVIAFFDDDFFPADDYLVELERLFTGQSDLVGVTGELLADGAHTGALSLEEAQLLLDQCAPPSTPRNADCNWLYGCNMAVRASAVQDLRFDENLPLYGWQEDVDFSSLLLRKGALLRTNRLTGVHLGTRRGRTSGLRFGYSQVANVLYLRRKGTIRLAHGWRLMLGNIAANLVGSLRSSPEIDRRGRLRGNAMAIADTLRGRLNPTRIVALQ